LSTITRDGDYYGYSLALGSAEVTLLELTNAYRVLANGGLAGPARTTPTDPRAKAPPPQRVVSPAAAFIVGDMMSDNTARALAFGFASPLQTRSWSAVKTGTSKDMRDNWALGFSSRYTVGVWVGNSGGEPMHDVSGVSGAAPLWHDVMQELHKRNASSEPVAPAGVVAQAIRYAPAIEPPRNEYFVAGTERQVVELAGQNADAAALAPRIVYPPAGTIIALDPDIPFDRQRMSFTATPARADAHWELDGARLGTLSHASSWFPMPGRHRLRIVDVKGAAMDEVAFEVRGAMIKPPGAGGARPVRAAWHVAPASQVKR
jgi:penicillin-binding protein 1C